MYSLYLLLFKEIYYGQDNITLKKIFQMNSISTKLALYYDLMRFSSYSGYLLVFFPALFGLVLAAEDISDLKSLPLFLFGSIISRSAGCIINDMVDRKYDRHVERTKTRPLATGQVSRLEALGLLAILLPLCLFILLLLSITSIIIGFIAVCLITIYPFMKRITNFPQIFLGITFNLGTLITYASTKDSVNFDILLIYIGCCFWTIGYDTVYAFMDFKDDKIIGIKSTALYFEKNLYRIWIGLFYAIFLLLFANVNLRFDNTVSVIASLVCAGIFFWQIKTLNINSPNNCKKRFESNNVVGFILSISMLIDFVFKNYS